MPDKHRRDTSIPLSIAPIGIESRVHAGDGLVRIDRLGARTGARATVRPLMYIKASFIGVLSTSSDVADRAFLDQLRNRPRPGGDFETGGITDSICRLSCLEDGAIAATAAQEISAHGTAAISSVGILDSRNDISFARDGVP